LSDDWFNAAAVFVKSDINFTYLQCSIFEIYDVLLCRGVSRGGRDMGECPSRHGLKKISPWITDRWLLCNWCHTPDVAKTKRKCAIL